jgi:hypothetical protein
MYLLASDCQRLCNSGNGLQLGPFLCYLLNEVVEPTNQIEILLNLIMSTWAHGVSTQDKERDELVQQYETA